MREVCRNRNLLVAFSSQAFGQFPQVNPCMLCKAAGEVMAEDGKLLPGEKESTPNFRSMGPCLVCDPFDLSAPASGLLESDLFYNPAAANAGWEHALSVGT